MAVYLTPAPVSGPLDSTQTYFFVCRRKEGPLFTDGLRFYFESAGVPSEMAVSGGIVAPMPQVQPGNAADGYIQRWVESTGMETRHK